MSRFPRQAASIVAAGLCWGGAVAHADSINFGQFDPEYTAYGSPLAGVTTGGVHFTLTDSGGFTALHNDGVGWNGEFADGARVLSTDMVDTPIIIDFATPISSITGLSADPFATGLYVADLVARDAQGNVIGESHYTAVHEFAIGAIPSFSLSTPGISRLVVTVNNFDNLNQGFALGGVPEPATWALLMIGVLGVGSVARRRRMLSLGRRQTA